MGAGVDNGASPPPSFPRQEPPWPPQDPPPPSPWPPYGESQGAAHPDAFAPQDPAAFVPHPQGPFAPQDANAYPAWHADAYAPEAPQPPDAGAFAPQPPDAFAETAFAPHVQEPFAPHVQDPYATPGPPRNPHPSYDHTGRPTPYAGQPPMPPGPPDPPRPPAPDPRPGTPAAGPGGPGGRRRPRGGGVPRSALVCLVLGAGLLCGAGAGALLGGGDTAADRAAHAYAADRDLWHDRPVDTLFPRTLHGKAAGPGGADRTWTRIGVAPDAGCAGAFDPPLAKALAPAGCARLLRATYTDATSTDVTTVGILFTRATPAAMTALRTRMTHSGTGTSPSAVPLPVAFPGTPAAGFGAAQRGSWTVDVSPSLPVVVYAVSGFADGRALPAPRPASAADTPGAAGTAAQAGLGFEADGLADAVAGHLHTAAGAAHGGGTP